MEKIKELTSWYAAARDDPRIGTSDISLYMAMTRQEFIFTVPTMIVNDIHGVGILKTHSYLDKTFTAWYQFDSKVAGTCLGNSWIEVYDTMIKWLKEGGYIK